MAILHELHAQIDQGKTAFLFYTEEIELRIKKNIQCFYMYEIVEQNKKPMTDQKLYTSWSHLLEDVPEALALAEQWSLK